MPSVFRSLDIVRIGDEAILVEDGSAGLEGVIDQIRRMDDGTYCYVVASLPGDDDGLVPGLYAERQLVATSKCVGLSEVSYLSGVAGPLGRRGHSVRVDSDGGVNGAIGYTIVDGAAHHI